MNKERRIYDNSNLNESYSGVVKPLTFSFARRVYQKVYPQFCRLLGVGEADLKRNSDIFPKMLAYIGGRMYYDLINWYRLIALLPGYRLNRRFLEQMMGVEEEFNHPIHEEPSFFEKYLFDLPKLTFRLIVIILAFIRMPTLIKNFNKEFEKDIAVISRINLNHLGEKQLINLYASFEEKMTRDFRVPIANDLAVMISVGILRVLTKSWLGDRDEGFLNLLLSGNERVKSLEPGFAMQDILAEIRGNKNLEKLFKKEDSSAIWFRLNKEYSKQPIMAKIGGYILKFGYRTPGELKLESWTFADNPELLIKLLKDSIRGIGIKYPWKKPHTELNKVSPIRRFVITLVANWARTSVGFRELTRFQRTVIFGYARQLFRVLARRLSEGKVLDSPAEIFYLNIEEAFALAEGSLDQNRAKEMIGRRRKLDGLWKDIEMPRRLEIALPLEVYNKQIINRRKKDMGRTRSGPIKLTGWVASQGRFGRKIIGEAVVINEFDPDKSYNGKILVTKQTDPGWTIIFPALRGLIVERGGVLSHAAIVSREFGLPCLINVLGATELVKDGQRIIMDLGLGQVRTYGED